MHPASHTTQQLLVNRIQRFCIHDGPGIRTTVFTQGCTLRCWWCHNPDTKPTHHPNSQSWDVEALLEHVSRDERYWHRSSGGVTVSGGEPLMQIDPMVAFLKACGMRRWHRCIETAGAVPLESVKRAAEHLDLWLWDIKTTNADRFKQGTQGNSQLVLDNLHWLLSQKANVIIRTPLINGFNSEMAQWESIAEHLLSMPRRVPLFILPGHECGTKPSDCITSPMVDTDTTQRACDYLNTQNIPTQITW